MNIQWVQNDYLTKGRSCWRESSGSCGWLSRIYRKYQLNLVTTKTLLKTTEGQSAQELKCHQAIWRMIWGLKIIYISEISVYYPALCVGMYYCLLQPPCSLSLIQSVKLISYTSFSPPPLCLYFSSKQMPEHSLFPNKGVMRSGQGGHAGEGWENRGGGERTASDDVMQERQSDFKCVCTCVTSGDINLLTQSYTSWGHLHYSECV